MIDKKHLAAYFPHELKVLTKLRETTESGMPMNKIIGELHGLYSNYGTDISVIFKGKEPNHEILDLEIETIKPILYSLEYLTKPITHKGETFVPIERLFDMQYPNLIPVRNNRSFYYEVVPNYATCSGIWCAAEFKIYLNDISQNLYWIVEQLIEWRFDVFKLIENNQAISVTETFNPYIPLNNEMYIKITRFTETNSWYREKIGERFKVLEQSKDAKGNKVYIVHKGKILNSYVDANDCVVCDNN